MILSICHTSKQMARCHPRCLVDPWPRLAPRLEAYRVSDRSRTEVPRSVGAEVRGASDDVLTSPAGRTTSGAYWHLQIGRMVRAAVRLAPSVASPSSGL